MPSTTEETIRHIYRETLDDFYAVVSRRCDGDRDLAEDVVQETWLRAVRAWQADRVPEKPMAWLTTVASRSALLEKRTKVGAATDLESLQAQLDVRLQEIELQKLSQRLIQLRSGKTERDESAGGTAPR